MKVSYAVTVGIHWDWEGGFAMFEATLPDRRALESVLFNEPQNVPFATTRSFVMHKSALPSPYALIL